MTAGAEQLRLKLGVVEEHLSRSGGTLAHADLLLVVCEPTRRSSERIALAGVLPYDDVVAAADRAGPVGLVPVAAEVQRALDDVLAVLDGCRARIAR